MALSLILAGLTVVGVLLGSRPWDTSSKINDIELAHVDMPWEVQR